VPKEKQEIYIDQQEKSYIFFVRYFGRILLLACILILLIGLFEGRGPLYIKRTVNIIIAFLAIGIVVERFMRRIACKIIIDFDTNMVSFIMCRSNEVRKYNFSSIEATQINRYAKFTFKEEKIVYNIVGHEKIREAINRLDG